MIEQLRLGLRSLDPKNYEQFCFDFLRARYPGLEIRHVDGTAGDEGIDLFSGDLNGRPVIWQCKSFRDCVRDSQKEQIRESLRQALKHFTPALWVLCIPIDMDTKAHRWWQRLQASYAHQLRLDLLDASETIDELLYRRLLRASDRKSVAEG